MENKDEESEANDAKEQEVTKQGPEKQDVVEQDAAEHLPGTEKEER